MGKVIVNKFPGTCQTCATRVEAQEGVAFRDGKRWVVRCSTHKGETHGANNPWREIHRQAEMDYTGGEYTRAMGRRRVDSEYNGTDSMAEPCPTCEGTCHWRATVGARQCPGCGTMICYRIDQTTHEVTRSIIPRNGEIIRQLVK